MKVYLCWVFHLASDTRVLTGAFESKERAEKWLDIPNSLNTAVQEIDVIMETPNDKEFEKISKHWKSLE